MRIKRLVISDGNDDCNVIYFIYLYFVLFPGNGNITDVERFSRLGSFQTIVAGIEIFCVVIYSSYDLVHCFSIDFLVPLPQ